MEKEAPKTPKSRRFNRPTPGTPESVFGGSTEMLPPPRFRAANRTTMAPSDFAAPGTGPVGKKRLLSCRQSLMPAQAQSFLDTTRRLEPENKDLEMGLLYDKYLQTKMIELLMKRKAEKMEKSIISQLGTLTREKDAIDEQSTSMKRRERDLRNLMEVQDSLDTQICDITACLEDFEKKPVEILSHLQSILASLDMLRCRNIIIPNTPEDMQKIHDLLTKCGNILQSINHSIGSNGNSISTVNEGLQDFAKAHADVRDCAKKTEESLCNLQILILRETSNSLRHNEL